MPKVKQNVLNIGRGTSYTKGHQSALDTSGFITGWSKDSVYDLLEVTGLANSMPTFFPGDPHLTPRRATKIKWEEGQKAHVQTTYSRRRRGGLRDRQTNLRPLFSGKTLTNVTEKTYFGSDGQVLDSKREGFQYKGTTHYIVMPRTIISPVVEIKLPVRRAKNPVATWSEFYKTVNNAIYMGAKEKTVRLMGMTWKAVLVNDAAVFNTDYVFWFKPDGWAEEVIPAILKEGAYISEVERDKGARAVDSAKTRDDYRKKNDKLNVEPLKVANYEKL